ncbi:MAG: hypothetical protein ACXV8K_12035 [Ilumatobacteraceae bacterium]
MRWLAIFGVLIVVGVGCSSGPTVTAPASSADAAITTASPKSTIRVELADGCPSTIAGHADDSSTAAIWVANPDSAGLDTTFVPGTPTAALICRYAAQYTATDSTNEPQQVGGDLFTATTLDAAAAAALAESANEIVPSSITSACLFGQQATRYTLIVFAVPGRSDIDTWLKDWIGCPELSNGTRTSGELINGVGRGFLAGLDADAPPAPLPPSI